MFYNTGIATYIWVLTNRKTEQRKGKIQLIDASEESVPLRKNLGNKNCELSNGSIKHICHLILTLGETSKSKFFPNEAFGYWKIVVERPLRLRVEITEEALKQFRRKYTNVSEQHLASLLELLVKTMGTSSHADFNVFKAMVKTRSAKDGVKFTAKHEKLLQSEFAVSDEHAAPVIRKVHKWGKVRPNPMYGLYEKEIDGKRCVVEYEPDTALRDTEQVPLLEEGGIEAFFRREVLPYVADAWIDESKTQIGYEISFTRHFYEPAPLRTLKEITADIFTLEQENEGLLEQIVGEKA